MAQAKIAEGEKSRQGNSGIDGEDVYAAVFMLSVEGVKFGDMTKETHLLMNFQEFEEPENIALGDCHVGKALGSERIQMNMLFSGTDTKKAVLYNVLYVPKLTCNLFSV